MIRRIAAVLILLLGSAAYAAEESALQATVTKASQAWSRRLRIIVTARAASCIMP